ncbi:MAG: tetratricopeptide repeat protein [Flavobacteriales bacterium]|nr:tetratricopeptide repeat protein [Flavobacteriales bacterium]
MTEAQEFAEKQVLDSLKNELKKPSLHDTTYISLLAEIGEQQLIFRVSYWDSIASYSEKALQKYNSSKPIVTSIKNSLGTIFNNTGYIHKQQGDLPTALNYYDKSLKLREELGDKEGMANSYNNIGIIHRNQGDLLLALDYYDKSLEILEELADKKGMANLYNNIGYIHANHGDLTLALDYYGKSLKIQEGLGDKRGIAKSYNNIAYIIENQGNKALALDHLDKSLKLYEEIGDKWGMAVSYCNIGDIKMEQGNLVSAKTHGEKSLKLAHELGFPELISRVASLLSKIAKQQGDYKGALNMYELQIQMQDSLESEANQKAAIQQQFKYEYEKKAAADSIQSMEEAKVQEAVLTAEKAETEKQKAQVKQQEQQKYYLFGGLALALLFGGFIFNRFRVTSKQKDIIEEQKSVVERQKEEVESQKKIVEEAHQKLEFTHEQLEESHKEITDSINYAERIQRSFLATKESLDAHLKDYFVFFRPKDVVSGDFYWGAELNDGKFAWSVADSTGHGVPGAIMSLLNISSLEKSIETETSPEKILFKTREIIINRLKKDGSAEGGKDGMDCNLLVIDKDRSTLTFASANNPVVVIRGGEILEFKGDKIPVGKHDRDQESFTLQTLQLQKGDVIYALTDGFPDQFGGEKGKKYMIKNLKNKLLKIASLSMSEQEQFLSREFDDWKKGHEQIDDVCIIGVRV